MLRAYRVRQLKPLRLSGKNKYILFTSNTRWMGLDDGPEASSFHSMASEQYSLAACLGKFMQIYVSWSVFLPRIFIYFASSMSFVVRGCFFFLHFVSISFVHSVWLKPAAVAAAAIHSFIFLSFFFCSRDSWTYVFSSVSVTKCDVIIYFFALSPRTGESVAKFQPISLFFSAETHFA